MPKKKRPELMTFNAHGLRLKIEAIRKDYSDLHGLDLGGTISYLIRYAIRKIRGGRQTLASILADALCDKRYPWYSRDHAEAKASFAEYAMLDLAQVDLVFDPAATVSDEIIAAIAGVLDRDVDELLAIHHEANNKVSGDSHDHAERRN